jgi:hypothetical protein
LYFSGLTRVCSYSTTTLNVSFWIALDTLGIRQLDKIAYGANNPDPIYLTPVPIVNMPMDSLDSLNSSSPRSKILRREYGQELAIHTTSSNHKLFPTIIMPLTDAQKERYDLAVEKIRVVIGRRPKDASYQNEYKKIIRWVEENNLRVGDKYIHRESVDQYFQQSVILRTCRKDSVTQIIQSLQWFYLNLETPRGDFIVRNRVVREAINQQQENRTSRPSSNLGTDPYKGLKDILADTDKKKMVTHIHNNRRDWVL